MPGLRPEDPRTLAAMDHMALLLLERYDEAMSMLNAGYEGLQASPGAQHTRPRNAAAVLADLYQAMGRDTDAQQWRAKAQSMGKDAS